MASIASEARRGTTYRRVWFYDRDNQRRAIRLGAVNMKAAEAIACKVEALNSCLISGCDPGNELAAWIADLGDDMRQKLRSAGFERFVPDKQRVGLDAFIGEYIGTLGDYSERTRLNERNTRKKLTAFLGVDRDMASVKVEDAIRWRAWLAETLKLSEATISGHIKRTRHYWAMAIERGICRDNPFLKAKAGSMANDARKQYIPAEWVERVISVCPDPQWRLLLALSRFAGLRCPSETLEVKWSDVDWAANRITIRSKKTAKQGKPHRVIPIFERLRPYLVDAFEAAEPGAVYLIDRYRSQEANLRTQAHRYIRKAGLVPWERCFHQLRASCQTDLEQRHGIFAAACWLGNSPAVAARHYLSVSPETYDAAAGCGSVGGATVGAINRQVVQKSVPSEAAESCTESQETQEPSGVAAKMPVIPDGSETYILRPTGFEQLQESSGNTTVLEKGGATDPETTRLPEGFSKALLNAWEHLDDAGRRAILDLLKAADARR